MFHHPAYVAQDVPKDVMRAETIQDAFVPVMEEAGVDLVLSGHQHVYMRTFPMKNGKLDEDGITYIIGNASDKHYNLGSYEYIACGIENEPVYSIITVNEKGIFVETKNISGEILDSTKGPTLANEQKELSITIKGDGIDGEKKITFGEIAPCLTRFRAYLFHSQHLAYTEILCGKRNKVHSIKGGRSA